MKVILDTSKIHVLTEGEYESASKRNGLKKHGVDASGSGLGKMVGSCEQGNEPFGCINEGGDFFFI
jgi:hypothetical protein